MKIARPDEVHALTCRGMEISGIVMDAIKAGTDGKREDVRAIAIGLAGAMGSYFYLLSQPLKTALVRHFIEMIIEYAGVELKLQEDKDETTRTDPDPSA